MDVRSVIAATRFGLGARPDQPPPEDPEAWLLAQLDRADPVPPPPDWEDAPTLLDGLTIWRDEERDPTPPGRASRRALLADAERDGWAAHRILCRDPFRERLAAFWVNHLTVSRREGYVNVLGGPYLRDAIRPHVTGRFADMLVAAVRHPAMLIYLNNSASVGPDSPWGRRSGRGLNENLAREVLELHTVSPAAGYGQEDVTEFARLLTGLGVETRNDPLGPVFRPNNHQPGTKTVLGRAFPPGEAAVDEALRFLADHPATHRHLATKLARHFVADEPPAGAVRRIEGALRDTGGDLGAAARELVVMPECWEPPLGKLRAPDDHLTAAARALGAGAELARVVSNGCAGLGQGFLQAPAPIGWPDRAADWAHPEGAMGRFDLVHGLSGRFSRRAAADMLDLALGPLARAETRLAASRAGSNRDALTLVLGSPEFQRR